MIVKAVLPRLLNKCARNQPMIPVVEAGGTRGSTGIAET
jgi:hypothetical protein